MLNWIIVIVIVLSASLSLAKALQDRDPQLAVKLVSQGALLLDVRTDKEYKGGHIENALNIPVQELQKRMGEITAKHPKDKAIVVYCRSGGRASKAKAMLLAEGYKEVTNMGGYTDWPKKEKKKEKK